MDKVMPMSLEFFDDKGNLEDLKNDLTPKTEQDLH